LSEDKQVIDPEKERARVRHKIREMREMKLRGLYDGDEHVFWRDIQAFQEQLDALQPVENETIANSAAMLLDIQGAWQHATQEEKRELAQMLFLEVNCDLEEKRVTWVKPRSSFEVLFQIMDSGIENDGDHWIIK